MKRRMTKRFMALIMVLGLLTSLLPNFASAAEADYRSLLVGPGKRPSQAGALSLKVVNGQKTLVDKKGQPIQLRGMSTHGLQWFPEILNENAFSALSNDWGSNLIRLAMYVGEGGYASDPKVMKQRVIDGIELAKANDMYVIVDWHVHAPGDPNADVYKGALNFFKEISSLYPNDPHIIYELANEPSSNSNDGPGLTNNAEGWAKVKSYAEPIIKMLRDNGNQNIVIVGSPNWSQRADLAADNPIDDPNTMYTVHFYTGSHPAASDSSNRENVMSNARYALEKGQAVFATEWGTSEANGNNGPYLEEANQWINFLNENNISWANWSLTNKNETSAAFTPFQLGKTEATDLDPGADQVWAPKELSLSGEYVRARIKGVSYEPIDRTKYSKVLFDFNESTQGFGVNGDSPVKDVTLKNVDGTLQISGLSESSDVTADNYWANVRLSADNWSESVDVLGAQELSMEVIVDKPTTVSIAAIPQGPSAGWANPTRAIQVNEEDFVEFGDQYKAVLTITKEDAPSLATIAESPDNNKLENLILFVGAENTDIISLDNITVTGKEVEIEVINDPEGAATLPSTFEDDTRQGWKWSGDSGVKTALTIEEANGSKALSWEFGYPDVKPTDNWASAPRIDFWLEDLKRGDNEYVAFDLYLDPTRATEGGISINLVFQPESLGFWQQSAETFDIDLTALDSTEKTADGLYHYEVKIDVTNLENVKADTALRNMLLIFADDNSDFAGRMFVDNVRFNKASDPDTGEEDEETPAQPGTGEDEGDLPAKPGEGEEDTPIKPGAGDDNTSNDLLNGEESREDLEAKPVKNSDKAGEKLPNTATNSFNTLLFGGIVLLLGAGAYFYVRRKHNLEQE